MILRFTHGRVAGSDHADVDIDVADGRIVRIAPASAAGADAVVDLAGGWLLPGFVDTQVNGGGGVLFNDAPTVAGIAAIGAAHARFGTTAFLPTLISDTPDRIALALDAVDAAIEAGVPGVVGVHVEGPFINVARRGIHEPSRIQPLDGASLALLTRPRRGRVMVTLAPESCAPQDIAALVAAGVIVSAGHSDATYEQATAAFAAGATGATHLFNAMSPLQHRTPGMVGAALDSDAYCGLIVDDIHVHAAAVRIALAAKGAERIMLVTDAMPSVGTADEGFMLQGKRIVVRDGACLFDDGTLAGAHLDMAQAVRNTVAAANWPVPTVAAMASATPARFLGLADCGAIAPGRRADFAWLDADLMARGTWIAGERVA